MEEPAFLTVRSASLLLDGISETIIREAIASKELASVRIGSSTKKTQRQIDGKPSGAIRIPRKALIEWAESKTA
ncbi:hypothetical protein ATK74_1804 [Propionicimonas paludicola]|uniref:Helix-turn-helix protein n=2 Tax=Propionicimonas paludicola TaxID=185243 RepID=A0A2A9CSU0_9ACTN|nr:hypothetical protein ATK74_1804 [Propionicimonas paludicola]